MVAHSQYCEAGDHTLGAIDAAVARVAARALPHAADADAEERVVVVVSDANFRRYGITPGDLNEAMRVRVDWGQLAVSWMWTDDC